MQSSDNYLLVGAKLSGRGLPDRARGEPRGLTCLLADAVALDAQSHFTLLVLRCEKEAAIQFKTEADRPTLQGDLAGFELAAGATRIRLAYTQNLHFAIISVRSTREESIRYGQISALRIWWPQPGLS